MADTLTFDLVARDKSFDQVMGSAAKSGEQLGKAIDKVGKDISTGLDDSFKKAGKSGIYLEKTADDVVKAWDQAGKRLDKSVGAALRAVSSDLDKIERDAWESGSGISDAFATNVKKARAELDRLRVEGARTGAGLESELGQSLKSVRDDIRKLGPEFKKVESEAEEAGEGIGSALSEGLSNALDSVGGGPLVSLLGSFSSGKAGFAAAGLAIGGLLMSGVADAIERRKVGAMVAAQTGQAAGSAGRMGSIAGDVFADNFGESLQDVGAALTAVFQNRLIDTSASDAAIRHITEKVMTLSDVMGEEANEVARSARMMVVNGLARNIDEAMDIIQHATESGLNAAGDLLDTISEYSSMFRKVGLDGAESMGLIGQALRAGARDSDYAGDAIKEFQIRAQDGSATTARGFQALGLDAKRMGDMVAQGGEPAKQALREVLNALQGMPPSVARSTAAVDLFGTKAEDLGNALYHMDLDNAANQFGDFAGSVQEAANRMSEGQTGAEKLAKGFENAKGDVGDFLFELGNLGGVSDDMQGAADRAQMFALAAEKWKSTGSTEWLEQVKQKFPELSGAIDEYIAKHKGEVEGHDAVTESVQAEIKSLDELIAKKQEEAGVTLSARDAERGYQEAVDDASEAIKANGKTHDDNTAKGRANNQALDDLAKAALDNAAAMSRNGRSTQDVANKMAVARRRFIETAVQMGYTRAQARTLANQLGLIPRNIRVNVSARMQAAAENLRAFKRAIDNIPRYVQVDTIVRGANITGSGGHMFRASGGPVKADHAYVVGEEGRELFVPDTDGTIIPNDKLGSPFGTFSPGRGPFGAAPMGGVKGRIEVALVVSGGADSAAGTMIAKLVRTKALRLEVRKNQVVSS